MIILVSAVLLSDLLWLFGN